MANFFTRALDKITPWNRGGEVQRNQQAAQAKKKKQEDQQYQAPGGLRVSNAQPNQQITFQGQQPTPQQPPTNIFETLNKNLVFNKPQNTVPLLNNPQPPAPQPGAVIKPTLSVTTAPAQNLKVGNTNVPRDPNMRAGSPDVAPAKGYEAPAGVTGTRGTQNGTTGTFAVNKVNGKTNFIPDTPKKQDNRFWQKVGRGFKTAGQTAVGTVENVPEVGLATLRAGSGIVQGVGNLPHDVTALAAGGTEQVQKHFNNPVTRQVNRGFQDVNTGVKKGTHYVINDVFDPLNRGLDTGAKTYERNVPGAAGGEGAYKATQVPINALAALLTLGSSSAGTAGETAEGVSNVSKLSRVKSVISDFLNKPLTSNEDNIIAKTGRAVTSKGRPVAEVLNAPIKSTSNLINRFRPNSAERGIIDSGEIGNLLTDAQATDLATTQVPVATGIDVNAPPSEGVNVPVRNANTPTPIIQEVGGDAKNATTNAQAAQNVINARRVEAAKRADTGLPDQAIEGVTPRTGEKPFVLNPETVATGQDKIVSDYADMLKSVGEGNGTQLVPDGEGGYIRTSNNFRSAENSGKRMTKQDWLDEAKNQLDAGKAEPGVQGAFNDAADPEVQALLTKGEQAPAPEGRPITVKQSTGIPVTDQTVVPQNLPETPGTVRVTTATAPANAKSEAVAAQATTAPVKDVPSPDVPATATTAPAATETLPRPDESDETFLKRVATDMQSNIKRAVTSLKTTKQMTKAERANRAAAGEKAYQEAKAAGLSPGEQEAARKSAYSGAFDRMDYSGTPIHSEDEKRLRDMVDEHYKDMPYQAGNVREAFGKLFHSGEPGYHSEAGNHVIPSDIKNIRRFLNESVPNPDGNGGLGDFAETAIKELAAAEPGPGKIANAIGLQRALRFTADISATGRQALPGALSHPIEFAKAAKKSFAVMFSHEKYQKYASELANSKEANYINDRLGAYIPAMNDDISKADDIYRNSGWAHKIPGVNKVVAASERQYNTILGEMRRQAGQRFIDAAGGIGNLEKVASDSGDPESFLKAIGTVANVNTGRGFGKALDTGASKILSDVLVSPRGLAARIQRFNPKYYTDLMKANPAAGKEALRSLGIQTAVTVSALGAANKAGIYEDGQIKVGNTRYDVTGGAANMIRTAVRVAQYIGGSRETTPFNSAETEVTRWARNQLSPFLASSLDAIGIHQDPKSGTWINRWGEDVTLGSTVLNNIAPVNASQIASDKSLGTSPGQTAINAGLNTLGIGVNTYESTADKAMPKSKSARDIYKQLTKEGIGTSTTDVNNYIADGNYDTANRVAEYNLMALQADPKSSDSQIKKAEETIHEIQLHKDGVPMTDDGITAKVEDGDWDKAIQGYEYKIEKAKKDGELSKKTESGIKNDITRAEVSRDNNIDPQLLSDYKSTSLADWRKMGIPPGDKNYDPDMYDPEMYQKLWDIDQQMTKKGVSYNSKGLDKTKYSAKDAKGSGSGSSTKQLDTSFGTLKEGLFAPRVQQYDTIDAKSGSVPHISVVRPNIVHKIGSSG
jgi:hypothetical protein